MQQRSFITLKEALSTIIKLVYSKVDEMEIDIETDIADIRKSIENVEEALKNGEQMKKFLQKDVRQDISWKVGRIDSYIFFIDIEWGWVIRATMTLRFTSQ